MRGDRATGENRQERLCPLLFFCFVLLLVSMGCQRETAEKDPAIAETSAEEDGAEDEGPIRATEARRILDQIEPAIPLWPGSRMTGDSVRRSNGTMTIDLWSNDPFRMIWHYYVLYLAQYRGWDPPDPYPSSGSDSKRLELDLNEVMRDPFVPGTALDGDDPRIFLQIREGRRGEGVNIRYVIRGVD
ncbi:MAG: hypothetical protein R3338_13955 [Thermoanaerobaculia bacterium]|nr:hypothetical protein [Thermoanaerobaculia bacterium]